MKRYQKILAVFVMVLFLLPNLYVFVKGEESFPFTQAPMFGHYIGDSTVFYDFRFIAQGPAGDEGVLPSHPEQRNALATQRFFFHHIYGSVEKNSPFGYHPNDTPANLSQRMDSFFRTYFQEIPAGDAARIQVVVDRYNRSYDLQESRAIGHYNLTSRSYTHTWKGE